MQKTPLIRTFTNLTLFRHRSDREKTVIADWIANYSTIASLANEDAIIERYFSNPEIENEIKGSSLNLVLEALFFAVSQFMMTIFYVPVYYVFASNVEDGKNIVHSAIPQVLGVVGGIYFSNWIMNAPDFRKGKRSANTILNIIHGENEGNAGSIITDGDQQLTKELASKGLEFRNVWFKYPTSWGDWILKDFWLKINGGTSVGIVGESGAGKSTIVQLILRFYVPQKGDILIGGVSISKFTLSSLREVFGLVQNIKY